MRTYPILLLAVGLPLSCGDPGGPPPEPPAQGTGARVIVTTSGLDLDQDGYRVTVDGSDWGAISANGTKVVEFDSGSRTIALTDLAPNCALDSPGSRTVTVVAAEVVPLEFVVACTATSGVIGVVTSGNGGGALFEAMLDGGRTFPVLSFEPTYLSDVPAGDHVVSLSAPDGCSVETGPRSVTVTAGSLIRDTAEVTFSVVCVRRFGTGLAFVSHRDGNTEIYVMNADGSAQTRLTNNPADDSDPQWSPDGRKIAFVSDRDGTNEIYVMKADGSAQTRLTNNAAYESDPQWSSDGQKIAFVSDRDGNTEIVVMNADGSAQTRLTNNAVYDSDPQWSPDGQKIAFVSGNDAGAEVYVMNADGSMQTRLTTNLAYENRPLWSPDGKKIAFVSGRDGGAEVYMMNADGSTQTRLTTGADFFFSSSAWSPDGQHIAFVSGDILGVDVQICVANTNGLPQRCLTRLRDNLHPVWSPDGQTIAFSSTRDRNLEVYVMNANGSAQTRLTNNAAVDGSPRWRP